MCRYTTLLNMNVKKWHHSEIHIAINDESQGNIAKKLKCDELLYYTYLLFHITNTRNLLYCKLNAVQGNS